MPPDDRLWNFAEVAHYLNKTPGTIRVMTSKREIPHIKIGRSVRYRKTDIDSWLNKHRVSVLKL